MVILLKSTLHFDLKNNLFQVPYHPCYLTGRQVSLTSSQAVNQGRMKNGRGMGKLEEGGLKSDGNAVSLVLF